MSASGQSFESGGNTFYNVEATNENGTFNLKLAGKFNKFTFRSNANILDNNSFDTLKFSPGFTYTITSSRIQTIIKQFDARGNSCFPILIKSSIIGAVATISKSGADVSCDFLSIKDINAEGGSVFYAGSYSMSIGENNKGWTFGNSPDYIYGFGPDTILCQGDVITTYNFNGAKSYLWHDGSTESWHEIDGTGLYWVQVNYGDNCIFSDSIYVEVVSNAFVDLGSDIIVCKPNTPINIEAYIKDGIAPYEITWEPNYGIEIKNSQSVVLKYSESLDFVINVISKNGCFARDTIKYIVIENFVPEITKSGLYLYSNSSIGNQWLYEGEYIPGATEQKYLPHKTGNYSVIITDNNGCISQASQIYNFTESDFGLPTIIVGSGASKAGEFVRIPIFMSNIKNLLNTGIDTISAKLYFNPSLLKALNYNQTTENNKSAFIELNELNVSKLNNDTLAIVEFISGLGNSETSDLIIKDVTFANGNADLLIINGLFRLTDICYQGGARLINPSGISNIISVSPNPVLDKAIVKINLIESGISRIYIFDTMGRIIKEIAFSNQLGTSDIELDLSNISNGTYILLLKTATTISRERLILMK